MNEYYSRALEFCLENGIILNEAQQEALKDKIKRIIFVDNPIKKFKNQLEDLKNKKPNEYSSTKDVSNYVNKNYNTLIKAAEIMEKEPEKLRSTGIRRSVLNGLLGFASVLTAYLGIVSIQNKNFEADSKNADIDFNYKAAVNKAEFDAFGDDNGINAAFGLNTNHTRPEDIPKPEHVTADTKLSNTVATIGILSTVVVLIITIIQEVCIYYRTKDDLAARNNLIKIESGLKKALKRKDLSESDRKKIQDIIDKIDDMATETMSIEKKVN